jgi:hypothetical protein
VGYDRYASHGKKRPASQIATNAKCRDVNYAATIGDKWPNLNLAERVP